MTRDMSEFIASWCTAGGPPNCEGSGCIWSERYGCTHPHHPDNAKGTCDSCGHQVDRAELQRVGLRIVCSECRAAAADRGTLLHPSQPPGSCEE